MFLRVNRKKERLHSMQPRLRMETTMIQLNQEYEEYIKEHFEESRESGLKVKEYLYQSTVAYHGRCVHTLHIPKIYSQDEIKDFQRIVKTTYGIFEKIILEYLKNPAYRRLFPFSKRMEELILVPNLYDSVLPIARFDIFYSEETGAFKFCEINTDGTSAMNEDRELNIAIQYNNAHQHMKEKYEFGIFELFDSWIDTFMGLYDTYEKKKENPRVAIVDFIDSHASETEFEEFRKRFAARGYDCEICDIRRMTYRDGVLYSHTGNPVDVIYRRAVTSDVEKHYEEIPDFIQAVKDQAVCLIGSFCTQIIHNKWLFKVIQEKETLSLLTGEEQAFVMEHIPETKLLSAETCDLQDLIKTKDRWIVKPLDSYASQGVFAGTDYSDREWTDILEKHMDADYIIQEYYPPHRTSNIFFYKENPQFLPYSNMAGLFVYNGNLAGVYSRLSDGGIISSQYNEKAVATLYLK